jgi:hypothetical protein
MTDKTKSVNLWMIPNVLADVPVNHPRRYQTEIRSSCDSDKGKNILMPDMAPNSRFFKELLIYCETLCN